MLTQSDWEPIVRLVLEETNKAIDRLVANFAPKLQTWLDELLNHPIPEDWREELAAFVQRTADDDNLTIAPHSIITLEELIESCIAGSDDFAEFSPAPRETTNAVVSATPTTTVVLAADSQPVAAGAPEADEEPAKVEPASGFVGYPAIPSNRRYFRVQPLFDEKLVSAKQHLDEIERLLKAAGDKIDAAKPDEEVDLGYEADMVRKHLFLYNEDLAVARDLWLRFSLSGDANSALIAMHTPVGLGLPMFASPAQADRARQQDLAINRRLRGQNASMDAVVTTVATVELAANAASLVAGAGALIVAAKKGGTWAVVKMVAAGAAAIAADKAADAGLRAAGASDQTIHGVRLAAAVITLILLHKVAKRAAPEKPTTEPPEGTGRVPPTGRPTVPTPPLGRASGAPGGSTPPKPVAPSKPTTEPPKGIASTPPTGQPPARTPPREAAGPIPPEPVAPPPSKPPFPPPQSSPAYSWPRHRSAAEAEEALARTIHALPDEVVVRWGDPIGSHGADVISVNMKTGKVTLWDNKLRSRPGAIQPSPTFQKPSSFENAIREASETIKADTTLPADIRAAALKNLEQQQVTTRTVGDGSARNSTLK